MHGRTVVAWGLAILLACPARAERRWFPGTPFRLTVATAGTMPERIEGRLVATGDTLMLQVPLDGATTFDTLLVATSDVTRAEVSEEPSRPNAFAPVAGALVLGGLAFVAAGLYLLGRMDGPYLNGVTVLTVSTAGGALLGGWLNSRQEASRSPREWREVPLSWLRES